MNETIPVSPAKSGVMLGVLFGVIMVLEFMVAYITDIDPISNPTMGIVFNLFNLVLLPVLLISMGCNNFKKTNHGFVTLGQCLKIGVTICLIAGLIYALFNVAFNMIFPEYVEEVLRKTRSVMMQNTPDMPAESADIAIEWTRKFMQPAIMIPATLAMYCLVGLIYSLIIGAIVKKEQPQSF